MGNRRTKRAATGRYCKSAWGRGPLQKDTHSRVRIPSRFRLWNYLGSSCTCLSLGQGPSSFLPTPFQHAHNQTGLRHYRHWSANTLAIAQAGVHRHQGKSSGLEAVCVAQNPTSCRKSWPPGEATPGHTSRRQPRDCLCTGCRGGQPRHGARSVKVPPWVVTLLCPSACTSRHQQPPCHASRACPPRRKFSELLLCMPCLLPRCSNHRQCRHKPTLRARRCPFELVGGDDMITSWVQYPEMTLPCHGIHRPGHATAIQSACPW